MAMMSFIFFTLLLVAFLQRSSTNPSGDDSSFSSLSPFDEIYPSLDTFNQANLDDTLSLENFAGFDAMGSETRVDTVDDFSTTVSRSNGFLTMDSDLDLAHSYCSTTNEQSQKRDDVTCPAENQPLHLTLPTLQLPSLSSPSADLQGEKKDWENSQPIPLIDDDFDDFDGYKCPGYLFIERALHACCDGPLGPYVLDPYGRMLYRYIKKCGEGISDLIQVAEL